MLYIIFIPVYINQPSLHVDLFIRLHKQVIKLQVYRLLYVIVGLKIHLIHLV